MAQQLDRSRPFGIISGDDAGRLYEQDDAFYRPDGTLWTAPAAEPAKPAAKAAKAAKPVAPATDPAADQVAAQLTEATPLDAGGAAAEGGAA